MLKCVQCRRLKKKCSGDPGDGSGCEACKAAPRYRQCVFIRPETWLLAPEDTSVSSASSRSSPNSYHQDVIFGEPASGLQSTCSYPVSQSSQQWQACQQAQARDQRNPSMPLATPVTIMVPSMNVLNSSWPAQHRQLPPGFTDPVYYISQARTNPPNTYAATQHGFNILPPFRGCQSYPEVAGDRHRYRLPTAS